LIDFNLRNLKPPGRMKNEECLRFEECLRLRKELETSSNLKLET
jgi:hypothetical protein